MSDLYRVLDRAIGDEGLSELGNYSPGQKINGGTMRCMDDLQNRIASFNNTRPSEQEILEWIDRAIILAESESYQASPVSNEY